MFKKRVLVIGNEGAVLFSPNSKNGIEREVALPWSLPDFNQQLIAALIKKNQGVSVLILFDGTDMAYRKEDDIPKLNSGDKKKFVKRKLDEAFGAYPIRLSIEMKPKDKKENSSYLFVAVTEMEHLDKIITALLDASVPIAGFGMLPLEAQGLMAELSEKLLPARDVKSSWAVIVTQNETGGLRQVVTKDGKLVLTRITPPSELGLKGEAWVDNVIEEFNSTEIYITRIGYSKEDGLDVIIVGGEEEKEIFKQKNFMQDGYFACVTPSKLIEALGFNDNIISENIFGDAAYAAWAMKRKSLSVPLKVPSLNNIMLPRLGARIAGAIFIVAILGLAGFNFTIYQQYTEASESVESQNRQKTLLDREYADEAKIFKRFPVKIDLIKATLAIRDGIDGKTLNIRRTLNVLKKALDDDMRIQKLKIEYKEAAGGNSRRGRGRGNKESGKDSVSISFQFSLVKDMPLEKRVIRGEQIINTMKQTFVGYNVVMESQFGEVLRDQGFSGDTKKNKNGKAEINDTLASILITGDAI